MNKILFSALAGFLFLGQTAAFPVSSPSSAVQDRTIEEITAAVAPSVVRVEARNGVHKVATGVVIDSDGSIVTTALISPRDEKLTVVTMDGQSHKAEFRGFDTQTGIAVVQVKEAKLRPIAVGKSAALKPGAWIGVVGLSPERTPAVTQGIVSSMAEDSLRLNVWVVRGSSGSPVVNAAGQMIGVLRGAYTDEQPIVFEFRERQVVGSGTVFSRAEAPSAGMAVAVPVDIVAAVSAEIRKSGKVGRGWLGVSLIEDEGRVVVTEVAAKSPAEIAKLRENDVILKVGDQDIAGGQALSREIRSRKPGTDVVLKIEREGKLLDVKVKLGEYSEEEARRELELNFPRLFSRILPPDRPAAPRPEPRAPTPPRPFDFFNRKYIGLTVQPLTRDLAAFFGVKEGSGLLVAEVAAGSPAEKAGLKAGDVILKASGKAVESGDELSGMIQRLKKGDKVKLEILRDKKPSTVEVEVDEQRESPGVWPWDFRTGTAFKFGPEGQDLARAFEEARKAFEEQARSMKKSGDAVRRIVSLRRILDPS